MPQPWDNPEHVSYAYPWSYSKLSCWGNCRKQFWYRYVKKIPQEIGPAAQRGTDIHKMCEEICTKKKLPCDFHIKFCQDHKLNEAFAIQKVIDFMHGAEAMPENFGFEQRLKVDKEFNILADDAKDYAAQFIYDVVYIDDNDCEIFDYKTGREYPESHQLQALIYAYSVAMSQSIVPKVTFLYLDQGIERAYTPTDEQLEATHNYVTTALSDIENAETFSECADSKQCRWCGYRHQCKGITS